MKFRPFDSGTLCVLGSAIAFGTAGVLGKAALNAGFAPFTLLFWRFALAALVLWAIAGALKEAALPRGIAITLAALGFTYAIMSGAYLHTVQHVGVSYAVLLLYAYPAVVALIERVYRRPLRIARVVAIVLALGGVTLLVHGPHASITPANLLTGIGAALAYGFYIFYGSDVLRSVPIMRATSVIMASAAAAFIPLTIAGGVRAPSLPAIEWLGAMVLCATALPVALLSLGMPKTGAAKASVLGTLEPLTGVMLAAAFFGEHLGGSQIAGAVLIAIATVL